MTIYDFEPERPGCANHGRRVLYCVVDPSSSRDSLDAQMVAHEYTTSVHYHGIHIATIDGELPLLPSLKEGHMAENKRVISYRIVVQ